MPPPADRLTLHRLTLPSVPASTAQAVQFAEQAARMAGFPQETADRLVLATGEAVANAIIHGNGLNPERSVQIGWTTDGAGGWLAVEDEGAGLGGERLACAELPDDPMQTRGRGLFIIRTLADAVEVEGSCVRLWFAPREEEPPSAPDA